MKKYLFLLLAACCLLEASAQKSSLDCKHQKSKFIQSMRKNTSFKSSKTGKATRANDYRLIGTNKKGYYGTYHLEDSSTYSYSVASYGSTMMEPELIYNAFQPLSYEYAMLTKDNEELKWYAYDTILPLALEQTDKYVKTYNAINQLTEMIILFWNGSTWDNSTKIIYTYDANGNIINELEKGWDSGINDWMDLSRTIRTFNASNKLLTELYENFDGVANTWNKSQAQYYQYDAQNRVVLDSMLSNYNLTTNNYSNGQRTKISYSSNIFNALIQDYDLINNSYKDVYKYDYNYLGDKLNDGKEYDYNQGTSNWEVISIDTFTYAANGKISVAKFYDPVLNILSGLIQYTYDAQNRLVETIEAYTPDSSKSEYVYNSNDKLAQDKYSSKDQSGSWILEDIKNYYYEAYNPASIREVSWLNETKLYPNPASLNSYISFFTKEATPVEIQVKDILGNTIYTTNEKASIGDHLIHLNLNGYPNGFYFVSLSAKNKVTQSLKLIKQ